MDSFEVFLRTAVMGFSLLLFIVQMIAYGRVKNTKLLLAGLAFFVFFVKGALMVGGIFNVYFYKTFPVTAEIIFIDFIILILLYLGIAKK